MLNIVNGEIVLGTVRSYRKRRTPRRGMADPATEQVSSPLDGRRYVGLGRNRRVPRSLRIAAAVLCMFVLPFMGASAAIDARPDPDACSLLSDLDLEPLLFGGEGGTLDGLSNHPAPGLSTCRWEARPKDVSPDTPPRTTTLSFYHLADRARAMAQLAAQPHGADDGRPSLAMDGHGDDEIVRSGPTVLIGRHGADVAVLDARGAELADPGKLEARYLLDALVLKAAGASVKSPPWARPGQKAAWAPLPDPAVPVSDAAWTPAGNPDGLATPWLGTPAHLLVLLMRHGFLMLSVGIVGSLALGSFVIGRAARSGSAVRKSFAYMVAPTLIAASVLNLVLGDALADRLIHRLGISAAASITGSHGTSSQYNNHNVVGYDVLIRSPGGGTISTGFEDDDFNVYPPHNATSYPGQGDVFTVRYLPGYASDFTIVSDDDSPWALGLRCARFGEALSQARARATFSRSASDQAAVQRAVGVIDRARCATPG